VGELAVGCVGLRPWFRPRRCGGYLHESETGRVCVCGGGQEAYGALELLR
jgi:hypothetical protein